MARKVRTAWIKRKGPLARRLPESELYYPILTLDTPENFPGPRGQGTDKKRKRDDADDDYEKSEDDQLPIREQKSLKVEKKTLIVKLNIGPRLANVVLLEQEVSEPTTTTDATTSTEENNDDVSPIRLPDPLVETPTPAEMVASLNQSVVEKGEATD